MEVGEQFLVQFLLRARLLVNLLTLAGKVPTNGLLPVADRPISISGERKSEKEEKGKKYHRIERAYGAFTRSFTLPEGASGEKLSADFRDGILKVHIPKEESAKTKAIEVKVS